MRAVDAMPRAIVDRTAKIMDIDNWRNLYAEKIRRMADFVFLSVASNASQTRLLLDQGLPQ